MSECASGFFPPWLLRKDFKIFYSCSTLSPGAGCSSAGSPVGGARYNPPIQTVSIRKTFQSFPSLLSVPVRTRSAMRVSCTLLLLIICMYRFHPLTSVRWCNDQESPEAASAHAAQRVRPLIINTDPQRQMLMAGRRGRDVSWTLLLRNIGPVWGAHATSVDQAEVSAFVGTKRDCGECFGCNRCRGPRKRDLG